MHFYIIIIIIISSSSSSSSSSSYHLCAEYLQLYTWKLVLGVHNVAATCNLWKG
jgi:hypothetical protein